MIYPAGPGVGNSIADTWAQQIPLAINGVERTKRRHTHRRAHAKAQQLPIFRRRGPIRWDLATVKRFHDLCVSSCRQPFDDSDDDVSVARLRRAVRPQELGRIAA